MNRKVMTLCNLMILSIMLSGCGGRTAYNQRNFILETSRSSPQLQAGTDVILDVQSFSIDRVFSTKSLVYRKGQSEYETDFYNQFLIMPDDMITDKTRSWLSESGLFKLVLKQGSFADATHLLEGNIIALYSDFRDKNSPKATMKICFFLIQLSDKTVVFSKTYEATSRSGERTAESLVKSFDDCLTKILSDFEQDLQDQL